MTSKQDIISSIYYDRAGFGSRAQILKDSREKDATITKEDVEQFFKRNIEEKRKPRGDNSFVAPHAHFEYQLDLFFIRKNDLESQKFRVGLVLIDIFSKYATVIPIKSKEPPDMLARIMEGIQKMDKPKMFYSDEEGSLYSKTVIECLEKEKMKYIELEGIQLSLSALYEPTKICYLNELKLMKKRVKTNIQWIDYNFEILLTYNNKMV